MISEAGKTVVLVMGFILLSIGVFVYLFPYSNFVSGVLVGISYPYRTYSVPLSVAGLALIAVGVFLEKYGGRATASGRVE